MAKKLILLLLIIPIVIMILLFKAAQTVAIWVDVHVENIRITGDPEYITLDLDRNETYTLEYVITPTNAKEKSINVYTEKYGTVDEAQLLYELQEGKVIITPLTVGSVTLTLETFDRNKTASVTFHVISSKLQSIESTISRNVLTLGGENGENTAQITTKFSPEIPGDDGLRYISADENVVTVNEAGLVTAVGHGKTTITVISLADETKTSTVEVAVEIKGSMALSDKNMSTIGEGEKSIVISAVSTEAMTKDKFSCRIIDANGNPIADSSDLIEVWFEEIETEDTTDVKKYALKYRFVDQDFVGNITLEVTLELGGDTVTESCKISKVNKIDAHFNKEGILGIVNGQKSMLSFSVVPSDAKITYGEPKITHGQWNGSETFITVTRDGNTLTVESPSLNGPIGMAEIELTIFNKDDPTNYVTLKAQVEVGPRNIDVSGANVICGYENRFAIGGYKYQGVDANGVPQQLVSTNVHTLTAVPSTTAVVGDYNYKDRLEWYSLSDKVTIDPKTGAISFAADALDVEDVDFGVRYCYGDKKLESGALFNIRCVKNGINVTNYIELYCATKATDHSIVLQSDITSDFGKINGQYVLESLGLYETIHTTYDDTYYQNAGRGDEATVKILLKFENDLYGNNHAISAHNVTAKQGKFDNAERPEGALFQGPLDFVKLDQGAANYASVKAQDNICFALYEGVTVTNVQLRGYDFKNTASGSSLDLRELNWVGTTVEVFGDGVTIEYSELTNGRTVLRAFGDFNNSAKKINVTVTNCILSQAREFIMRIGSNQFINGGYMETVIIDNEKVSRFTTHALSFPNTQEYQEKYDISKLPFNKSNAYGFDVKKKYYQYEQEQKDAYDDAFIKTFVTVKDSVFESAGIFAIGMDSHFGGGMLHKGSDIFPGTAGIEPWHDLAKTSYGAKLTFKGTVKLLNWKALDEIDSTMLIETAGSWGPNNPSNDMTLYLKEMIAAMEEGKYPYIFTNHNGRDYVHAGIVFFGGGKNYCVFDSDDGKIVSELSTYDIDLAEVGKGILKQAAGNEKFYFFIYDKDPTKQDNAFTPEDQERILNSGDAYNFIQRKTKS